ncbi:hypothetical protein NDN08_005657 [Rhodosorus marinus]|uniref:Squalene synthase n=1 Tax=Rhodosorus marinus TaxID=101924 RepID=A0AAV8V4I9_9RHOD|nr:hypothetical protein NDN08_005657 [Rhodosorus marinus]
MKISEVLQHPEELIPLLKFYGKSKKAPALAKQSDEKWRFCFNHLLKVSRSFAMVIMELEPEVRDAVCIFYLVLRALDTVEDDTTVPASRRKVDCVEFYKHVDEAGWSCTGYGKEHEKNLLEHYNIVVECFLSLNERYQVVIREICQKMGAGMAEHIEDTECYTVDDYNRYCFYVAGLVGIGLSRLFYETGREDKCFVEDEHLSISMGQFLQKVNIIRDYAEDLDEERTFWPREIWSKYVPELADLQKLSNEGKSLACLNHMVTNALGHVLDCIKYMKRIKNRQVFNFCAIPQIMGIGTLVEVYNNRNVFHTNVKLRRGTTAKLVVETSDFDKLMQLYYSCCVKIESKIPPNDPSYNETKVILQEIMNVCMPHVPTVPNLAILNRAVVVLFAAVVAYLINTRGERDGVFVIWKGGVPDTQEMVAIAAFFLVVTYLFSFFGLQFVKSERSAAASF